MEEACDSMFRLLYIICKSNKYLQITFQIIVDFYG